MEDLIRAATYAEAQTRQDLRGPRATRTGKTKKVVCTPPNKKCGGRCIPPNWDCRLEGKGTNSELAVHRNDPLAGAASVQRGIVSIREGAKKGDLARIQRGRGAVIRGVVKIAPGDNLEQKKQLRRKLTQRSSTAFGVVMVAVSAVTLHGQLKRNFPGSYGQGVGRDIDTAAGRAMDAVLDRTPVIAGRRAAVRARGAAAQVAGIQAERFADISRERMGRALTRDYPQRLARTGTAPLPMDLRARVRSGGAAPPPGRAMSLADLKAPGTDKSLTEVLSRIDRSASTYDEWAQRYSTNLIGATRGGRSAYADDAAAAYLTSQFGLTSGLGRQRPADPRRDPLNAVGGITAPTVSQRRDAVTEALTSRLQEMRNDMEADMRLRRMVNRNGSLDTTTYINTVVLPRARQQMLSAGVRLPRSRQVVIERQVRERFNTILSSETNNRKDMGKYANDLYNSTVSDFDTFYREASRRAERAAGSTEGTATGVRMAMARQLTQSRSNPRGTRIVSPGHADLVLRDHFHRSVRRQNSAFLISDDTARRVASELAGRPVTSREEVTNVLRRNNIWASTQSDAPRPGSPHGYSGERLKSVQQIAQRLRQEASSRGESMDWATALRQAQREVNRRKPRGDEAPLEGTPPEPENRQDGRKTGSTKGKGKKCGESYIPRTHECNAGKPELKPALKTAAKVALGAGLAVGAAVAIDKKFKVREYHTGIQQLGLQQKDAPRKRRASYEMQHKVPEGPDTLKRKLDGLEDQAGVIKDNVRKVRALMDREDVHNNIKGAMDDFGEKAKTILRNQYPQMSDKAVERNAKIGRGIFSLMVRTGQLEGFAMAGSKNIYVKTAAPELNNHKANAAGVTSAAGAFMDYIQRPQGPVTTTAEKLDNMYKRHAVANNTSDGNVKDTLVTIHEVAHVAHFRASANRVGAKTPSPDVPLYDPDAATVVKHMRAKGITPNNDNPSESMTKFLSNYGKSDFFQGPPKGRAETFAELSVLYVTQGERLKREAPFAYAWTDLIWQTALT